MHDLPPGPPAAEPVFLAPRPSLPLALLVVGIAGLCVFVLHPFLSALLWAALLVLTAWPAVVWIERRTRLPRPATAAAMIVATTLLLAVPLALAAPGGAQDVALLRRSLEDWIAGVPPAPSWLHGVPLVGGTLTDTWNAWASDLGAAASFFRPYLGMAAERGLRLLLGVASGLLELFLALFAAFFFFLSAESLGLHLSRLLDRIAGPAMAPRLIEAVTRTARGTVYGILGTAILQGFLTAFGLALAGVPRAVLLGTVAAFLAVLPIGAPLVWVPAGLWLLNQGSTGHGIFLLVYGVVVVSGADHIVRPYFIARGARIPFLLVVLGVLGGVAGFGVLGIFLGPVVLGVGLALVLEYSRAPDPD